MKDLSKIFEDVFDLSDTLQDALKSKYKNYAKIFPGIRLNLISFELQFISFTFDNENAIIPVDQLFNDLRVLEINKILLYSNKSHIMLKYHVKHGGFQFEQDTYLGDFEIASSEYMDIAFNASKPLTINDLHADLKFFVPSSKITFKGGEITCENMILLDSEKLPVFKNVELRIKEDIEIPVEVKKRDALKKALDGDYGLLEKNGFTPKNLGSNDFLIRYCMGDNANDVMISYKRGTWKLFYDEF